MNKLTISLDAIAANYRTLKSKFTGSECAAVVKANGYGLGATPIAERLAKEGCRKFFVATVEEAIALRKTIKEQIFVFHGAQKNEIKDFTAHDIIPVINTKEQLEIWPKDKPCVFHYDTGMTRLGLDPNISTNENNVLFIMSHLACADEPGDHKNPEQLANFKKIDSKLPKSFCNSYGIFLPSEYHFDIARPGIGLYGGGSREMKNVVTLTAPILQIHEVTKIQTVGYGAEFEAVPGDLIATIPVGYADGIMRSLNHRAKAYHGEIQLPVVGRISMDLITIKINNLPSEFCRIGTMVEILGEKYNIHDMASDAGTIEYEIITRLGNRFERVYA